MLYITTLVISIHTYLLFSTQCLCAVLNGNHFFDGTLNVKHVNLRRSFLLCPQFLGRITRTQTAWVGIGQYIASHDSAPCTSPQGMVLPLRLAPIVQEKLYP